MDVQPPPKGLGHLFVLGQIGGNAKFKLGIIKCREPESLFGNKGLSDLAAGFAADGNILQIGILGGKPAGGGSGLIPGGVDAAIPAG